MELLTPITTGIVNGGFLATVFLLRGPRAAIEGARGLRQGNIPTINFEEDGIYIGLQTFDDPTNGENFLWIIEPRKTKS